MNLKKLIYFFYKIGLFFCSAVLLISGSNAGYDKTPEGAVNDDLIGFTDIFPTFADFARIKIPDDLELDGQSFAPVLYGEDAEFRDWLYIRIFSPANEHDSNYTEALADLQAKALFGDKGYSDDRIKIMAREFGWFYGIQDKARRNRPLSPTQHKRNRKLGRIRAVVEHPFAWMKTQSKALKASARSQIKNALIFDFTCMCWNIKQASLLLARDP